MDSHQTSIFVAILISCCVFAVIMGYFIVGMIRQNRRNIALYKEKMFAEITTLESERKRMASDLHDELGPIVAGIKLKLNSIDVTDTEDQKLMEKVHGNLVEMINRMKEISNDLMPVILVKKGLIEAIEVVAAEINRTGTLKIIFAHDQLPELSESLSINLYRILQEVIHNTIKHAGASTLNIEMRLKPKKLMVQTRDDGLGFNYQAMTKEKSGRGLQNLLSRTEVLGGNMYVESSPGKGTTYNFEIPLL